MEKMYTDVRVQRVKQLTKEEIIVIFSPSPPSDVM